MRGQCESLDLCTDCNGRPRCFPPVSTHSWGQLGNIPSIKPSSEKDRKYEHSAGTAHAAERDHVIASPTRQATVMPIAHRVNPRISTSTSTAAAAAARPPPSLPDYGPADSPPLGLPLALLLTACLRPPAHAHARLHVQVLPALARVSPDYPL